MSEAVLHPVPEEWANNALIDAQGYALKYRASVEDADNFWRGEARRRSPLLPPGG